MKTNVMCGPRFGRDNVRFGDVEPGTRVMWNGVRTIESTESRGLWRQITFTDGTTHTDKWDAIFYIANPTDV